MLSNLDLEREKEQALRKSDRNANDDDRRDAQRAPNRKEAMKLRGNLAAHHMFSREKEK